MLGKTLKTLLGLGSASAAAAGGLYLNNKLRETKENSLNPDGVSVTHNRGEISAERLTFAKLADDNAAKIESQMNAGEDTNSYYLPRSTDSDEYWEWLWLYEVNETFSVGVERTFTENEMKGKELEIWGKIKKGEYTSGVSKGEKEKIDGENPEYWKKYKETCLTWNNKSNSSVRNANGFECLTYFSPSDFTNGTPYEKYQELKKSKPNLTLRKYFWTIWFKFFKEKPGSGSWGEQFDAWKTKNSSLFV